jgi:hypothetical protein
VSPIDLAERLFGPEPDRPGPVPPPARLPEPDRRLHRGTNRSECGCAVLGSNARRHPGVRGLFSLKPGR